MRWVRIVVALILGPIALLALMGLGATFEPGPKGQAWGFRLIWTLVLLVCVGLLYAVYRTRLDDLPPDRNQKQDFFHADELSSTACSKETSV